jgi:hypothetical protein
MRNNIRGFIIGGFIASGLGALAVNIPFTFNAGSAIKASDINANFQSLKTAVDTLETSKPQTDDTLKGNGTGASKLGVKFPLLGTLNQGDYVLTLANGVGGGLFANAQFQGVWGNSSKNDGVYGSTNTTANGFFGVRGVSTGASGLSGGVFGEATSSPTGTGVVGHGGVTGGYFQAKGGASSGNEPVGVWGVAYATSGTGVYGVGNTWGGRFKGAIGLQVEGGTGISVSSKDGGSTLYLSQLGPGLLVNGFLPNNKRFTVDQDGNITTPGSLIANGVTYTSDRNAKTNFTTVNALEVLNKVERLPISRWNYKSDASSLQHVGPMAQDFHAAFGLNGNDDKHLSAVDVQGVTLAAIQGLNRKLEQKSARIANLEQKLLSLEDRLSLLEKR